MVRPATRADLDAVAWLEQECLGVDAWSRGLVEQGLAGTLPTVHYLVVGDPVAGHAVVSVAGDVAELQRIAVEPGSRRTGLASALLTAAADVARRGSADRLLLEVREGNLGARAFYAHHGLVEVDRRRRYYADGGDALVLRLPLVKGCG